MIFIDEIDALAGDRTAGGDGGDGVQKRVNQLECATSVTIFY